MHQQLPISGGAQKIFSEYHIQKYATLKCVIWTCCLINYTQIKIHRRTPALYSLHNLSFNIICQKNGQRKMWWWLMEEIEGRITHRRRHRSRSACTRSGSRWWCSWRSCSSSRRLRLRSACSWWRRAPARPPGSARKRKALGTRGRSNPSEVACRAARSTSTDCRLSSLFP